MQLRVPWNEELYELTSALYSTSEADVVTKMPYTFSSVNRICRTTGYTRKEVQKILDGLTGKGLVIDIHIRGEYFYVPSPLYIGIYEFTLMKTSGLSLKKKARFICQCCSDCCMPLTGIRKFSYPHTVITSNYMADIVKSEACSGCGKCARACPIDAIEMVKNHGPETDKKKLPEINREICLGCGVCGLNCKTGALQLVKREQEVFHPENTFERLMAQALECGTLQNQIFDDPGSIGHQAMRAILVAFLRLDPVKKALLNDQLRSRFFTAMRKGAKLRGREWLDSL